MLTAGEAGLLVHATQVILACLQGIRTVGYTDYVPMFSGHSLYSGLLDTHPDADVAFHSTNMSWYAFVF